MRVRSYMRVNGELAPVEVELSLTQGLPNILFLGLPDAALRESVTRIRSALRAQGFELPRGHQILVHLRPSHLRKTSRGLDLAVAAALLWEMEQVPRPEFTGVPTLYGELTLKGEVVRPDDVDEIDFEDGKALYTGIGAESLSVDSYVLRELKDLAVPEFRAADRSGYAIERPLPKVASFPAPLARLGEIVSAGEHSALLAGPPGGGKSTLAEALPSWIESPREEDIKWARKLGKQAGRALTWRPFSRPHHSITPLAMIGGGSNLWSGEISRAHGGVLVLDEMLEFHPRIQEALREPVESGSITIVRAGRSRTFPARLLLFGTTNLCPCGKFVPGPVTSCTCRSEQRRKAISRLNGPFADRFAIFHLYGSDKRRESVACTDVAERVAAAIAFRQERRGQTVPNAYLESATLLAELTSFQSQHILGALEGKSRRRIDATVRVARTIADLRGAEKISNEDLEESMESCVRGFSMLEKYQD